MSTFFVKPELSWFERLAVNIIKCGAIPKHLAVIMDGNRRYAKQKNQPVSHGHFKGNEKLNLMISWCRLLGIQELTLFTFSLDNFKRSKQEIDDILSILKTNVIKLLDDIDFLQKEGFCVQFIGKLSLLNEELRSIVAELMLRTKGNKNFFLIYALSYSAREEMSQAMSCIQAGLREGQLAPEDVDDFLFTRCLYTAGHSPPDVILRTSGETRLSDFLLWQSASAQFISVESNWPEVTIFTFLAMCFQYQRHVAELKSVQQTRLALEQNSKSASNPRVAEFLDNLQIKRWEELEHFIQ